MAGRQVARPAPRTAGCCSRRRSAGPTSIAVAAAPRRRDGLECEALAKETVRRLLEAFAAVDDAAMDRLLAPDFVAHGLPTGTDAEALRTCAAALHAALPDCVPTIDDVVAEGDRVAVRYTARATHTGELFGVAPTGRAVAITGIEIYRLVGSLITEYWGEADMSALFSRTE
jgi:predicted ester cyclase